MTDHSELRLAAIANELEFIANVIGKEAYDAPDHLPEFLAERSAEVRKHATEIRQLAERAGEASGVPEGWRKALKDLLDHIDLETCTHQNTHRCGAIWTICDDCGDKWADDRGGFVPHEDSPAVATARVLLAAAPTHEAQQGVAVGPLGTDPEKSWPDRDYLCECYVCSAQFIGHKRQLVCRLCAQASPSGGDA